MQTTPVLHGIGTHLKAASTLYFRRIWHLIGIGLVTLLVGALVYAVLYGAVLFGSHTIPRYQQWVATAFLVAGTLAFVWLFNWGATAAMIAVVHREFGVRECLSSARGKVLSAVWISLLLGFVMTGASFLVLPWILFSIWFYFVPFVLADGDTRGMSALLKSREYVRGYWFSVCFRVVFIWGLFALLFLVPGAGPLLAIVCFPLVLFYNGALYDNLKELRTGVWFFPRTGVKAGILVTSGVGYVLPPLVLLAVMGPMVWQVLQQYVPLVSSKPLIASLKTMAPDEIPDPMETVEKLAPTPRPATRSFKIAAPGTASDKALLPNTIAAPDSPPPEIAAAEAAAPAVSTARRPSLLEAIVSDISYKLQGKDTAPGDAAKKPETVRQPLSPPPDATASNAPAVASQHQTPLYISKPDATRYEGDILHWLRQGEFYANYGNYRAAIENFDRVIARDPDNSTAHFNRGVAYGEIGDFRAALDAIDRAIAVVPANGFYFYGRGRVLLLQGDREGAREAFRKAVDLGYKKAVAYL